MGCSVVKDGSWAVEVEPCESGVSETTGGGVVESGKLTVVNKPDRVDSCPGIDDGDPVVVMSTEIVSEDIVVDIWSVVEGPRVVLSFSIVGEEKVVLNSLTAESVVVETCEVEN